MDLCLSGCVTADRFNVRAVEVYSLAQVLSGGHKPHCSRRLVLFSSPLNKIPSKSDWESIIPTFVQSARRMFQAHYLPFEVMRTTIETDLKGRSGLNEGYFTFKIVLNDSIIIKSCIPTEMYIVIMIYYWY